MTVEGRTLYDIAHLLESAAAADERVRRVLELLPALVPYDQCALLEAGPGHPPRIVLSPDTTLDEASPLLGTLLDLFGHLVDATPAPPASPPGPLGTYLAVPLVGLDQVFGLLFVRWSGGYTEEHLRGLSVVAASLAAYLTALRGHAELRERDEARRAAEATGRAKDDLLTQIANQIMAPLDSILGSVRLLRSVIDPTALAHAIDELEGAVRAHAALIARVLEEGSVASREPPPNRVDLPRPPDERAGDHTLTGIRVLVADRDFGIRESVEAVLEHHGAEVTAVGAASEVLAAIDRSRPDVLLLGDLPLRDRSIDGLMREVTARACPLAVASISSWKLDELQGAPARGFQLHLTKPLEVGVLVDAVAELAGRTSRKSRRA